MNEYHRHLATITSLLAQARGEINAGETAKAHKLLKHALACAAQTLPEDIFLAAARHGQALATRPPQPEPRFFAALDDARTIDATKEREMTDDPFERLGAAYIYLQAAAYADAPAAIRAALTEMTAARQALAGDTQAAWLAGAARAQNAMKGDGNER